MQTVTITMAQIMVAIPMGVAFYCIAYNRKALWRVKKNLFHVFLGCVSAACVLGWVKNAVDERQQVQAEKLRQQNQIRKDHVEKMRLARESGEIPAFLPLDCEDPEQVDLPGEWWHLHQSLTKSNFWEAKLLGIEAFASQYGITDVPPLPTVGLNLILQELNVKSNEKQTWKYIHRATAALEPYLGAFNEACSVKAESKKSEKKNEKPEEDTVCGGIAGILCQDREFCLLSGECCCDIQGVCIPIPEKCSDVKTPVCGCDGITYINECEAHKASTSVNHLGSCDAQPKGGQI